MRARYAELLALLASVGCSAPSESKAQLSGAELELLATLSPVTLPPAPVDKRPSFMHTAQLHSLSQVVAFFNQGGDTFSSNGTNELRSLALTTEQQDDLVAFLEALIGAGPDPTLLQ